MSIITYDITNADTILLKINILKKNIFTIKIPYDNLYYYYEQWQKFIRHYYFKKVYPADWLFKMRVLDVANYITLIPDNIKIMPELLAVVLETTANNSDNNEQQINNYLLSMGTTIYIKNRLIYADYTTMGEIFLDISQYLFINLYAEQFINKLNILVNAQTFIEIINMLNIFINDKFTNDYSLIKYVDRCIENICEQFISVGAAPINSDKNTDKLNLEKNKKQIIKKLFVISDKTKYTNNLSSSSIIVLMEMISLKYYDKLSIYKYINEIFI